MDKSGSLVFRYVGLLKKPGNRRCFLLPGCGCMQEWLLLGFVYRLRIPVLHKRRPIDGAFAVLNQFQFGLAQGHVFGLAFHQVFIERHHEVFGGFIVH